MAVVDVAGLCLLSAAAAGGWTTALLSGDNIVAIVLGVVGAVAGVLNTWLIHRNTRETRARRLVVTQRGPGLAVADEDLDALAERRPDAQ